MKSISFVLSTFCYCDRLLCLRHGSSCDNSSFLFEWTVLQRMRTLPMLRMHSTGMVTAVICNLNTN